MAELKWLESWIVLVLPGAEARSEARDASVASVVEQGVAATRVFDPDQLAGAWPTGARHVAFIRPGDRWVQGHLESHHQALVSRPEAALSAGRYRRVDRSGDPIDTCEPPSEPPDAGELAIRCPIEASATAIRCEAVPDLPATLRRLTRPGGDVALWCACVAQGPPARVEAMVADVLWDPQRHGLDPDYRIEVLQTLAQSPVGRRGPAAASIRRELLSRVFLDGRMLPSGFDATTLAEGDPEALRELVADLQWTLEQQGRQLAALWRGWPRTPPEEELSRLDWPEDTVSEMTIKQRESDNQLGLANHKLQTLVAHLRERNAYITRLERPDRRTGA